MDPEKQGKMAQRQHAKAVTEGKTCIDCHQGIAHNLPQEPDEAAPNRSRAAADPPPRLRLRPGTDVRNATDESPRSAVSPPEPSAALLRGNSLATHVRRLWLSTRPAFLTASVLPVLVGTAWGYRVAGEFDALSFALALLATVLVHAASNVLNDVGDDIGGTDNANEERIFPYTGGSRFIQNGVMSAREMKTWGVTLLLLALAPGAGLLWLHGPQVLIFGAVGIALGVLYSIPKVQLSAHGLGETAVALAFGVLPVVGAAWLQSGVDQQRKFRNLDSGRAVGRRDPAGERGSRHPRRRRCRKAHARGSPGSSSHQAYLRGHSIRCDRCVSRVRGVRIHSLVDGAAGIAVAAARRMAPRVRSATSARIARGSRGPSKRH